MSLRRPAQPQSTLGAAGRSRETELANSNLLAAVAVTAELSSATTAYVNHGLGQRYAGAIVVGQDTGGGECRVLPPETVSANGRDPAVVVGLSFSSAFTGTVNLRVF